MITSMECPICFDNFTKEGNKCPKLLPCSHTLCATCLQQLGLLLIDCPECRKTHGKPVDGFPTNKYILEILDLQTETLDLKTKALDLKTETIDLKTKTLDFKTEALDLKTQLRRQSHELIATRIELKEALRRIENPVICDRHDKLCFKFCVQKECCMPLCSKCPLREHDTHEFVAITKDTKDFIELNKNQKGYSLERETLDLKTQLRSQSQDLIATRIELNQTKLQIENHVVCDRHDRLCFKFCIQEECWVPLCSKCPLQEHATHEFVAITKDIKDFIEWGKYQNGCY